MRRLRADTIIALVILVACAELYRETYSFRAAPFATMSSGTWPRFVLLLLAALTVALLVQSLLSAAVAPAAGPDAATGPISHRVALVCFGLFGAFLVVTPWLGMLVAGMLYVFVMQDVLGPRDAGSRLMHLVIAVLSVGGMWAVFTFALRVILPEGVLFRI